MIRTKSFSKRLTRRIVIALTLVMIIIIAGTTYLASRFTGPLIEAYFEHLADIENESIEKRLHDVQVAVHNSIDEVVEELNHPDSVIAALSSKLQLNPQGILGFGVGFVPNYYPERGRWFEPYAMWLDGRIFTIQNGSAEHDYFKHEWYVEGMKHNEGYWSNGYSFEMGGERVLICTYAKPIYDAKGSMVGVYAGDLSLDMLHDYLLSKDLKANTEGLIKVPRKLEGNPRQWVRSIIVDRNGNYVSHPDKERMLRDNFFEAISQKADTVAERVVSEMKAGKKRSAELKVDGVPSTVFYSPLEKSGWSLVVILPKVRYYIVVFGFCIILTLFLLLSLAVVYHICSITIRRSTRPLQVLASSADEVAKGNFNAPLPDICHQDEIGLLRDSFGNMQRSLSQYIEELKTTTAQKSAIESELSIARDIQNSMVPSAFPNREGLEVYASMTPAKAVGGDLYDFFLRDNSLYFCIGDVAGKGVPAALVMTTVCGAFRLLSESESEPVRIVSRMNDMMIRKNSMTVFVTFFAGLLDLDTGHLRYCNAGHKAPLVNRQPLPVHSNLPIGAMLDYEFEAQETDLAPGSTLFLYTDGLDEAEKAEYQMFGKKRIYEVMQTSSLQPHMLIERMTQAVADFVGNTEQSDDLTMLAIQWKK
jgi:sigma-B regulation protein RsbU (phosphoserine phosphatase)